MPAGRPHLAARRSCRAASLSPDVPVAKRDRSSAAQLLLRGWVLESPRWLAGRGVHDAQAAQLILAKLRAQPVDSIAVLQAHG